MAVEMKVTRNLNNNYVQIESSSNKTGTKHFRVPKENIDSFCKEYPSHEKKMRNLSDLIFISSVVLGCLVVTPLTKNLSAGTKLFTAVIAGLASAVGSLFVSNKIENVKTDKFLKGFNAQKINYNNSNIANLVK